MIVQLLTVDRTVYLSIGGGDSDIPPLEFDYDLASSPRAMSSTSNNCPRPFPVVSGDLGPLSVNPPSDIGACRSSTSLKGRQKTGDEQKPVECVDFLRGR